MSREQRVHSNFGLSYAQMLASEQNKKLFVVFALANNFLGATLRQYSFMFDGLREVEQNLKVFNIPFILLVGDPAKKVTEFARLLDANTIVHDFDPLKIKRKWQYELVKNLDADIYEVDGHNIVPCKIASQKQEFGAYTIRPKIKKHLDYFLPQSTEVAYHTANAKDDFIENNFENALKNLDFDKDVQPIRWLKSGEIEAKIHLNEFLSNKLEGYAKNRNDPNKNSCSNMSVYLHFGQIYAGDIAKYVMKSNAPNIDKEAYLEELIIRKELSDNYCFYNENYDNFEGFADWAKLSLKKHYEDVREFVYSKNEFESAKTDDTLWNSAQNELLQSGKIHGYMRMYWAKKILEWTPDIKNAQEIAIYLNDKYALDGRGPNGYTGIAWSIGGVHDRAWFDRAVFGKVRYMNANGAKSKFDVKAYCDKWF
jgi:deoxyribodipyrimidine photo-lyase